MPQRAPFIRSPVVLVAHSGTWLNRTLDSMLGPQGYSVLSVASGREMSEGVTLLTVEGFRMRQGN